MDIISKCVTCGAIDCAATIKCKFNCNWQPMKVKNMTREEAVKKIGRHLSDPNALITSLEALGLIKFDEPKEYENWPAIRSCGISKDNLEALKNNGYQIVKLGRFTTVRMKNGTFVQGELDIINQASIDY